ncbi:MULTISPECIES: ABC transporter permease subunit [unclassified Herbaspirillum]|uniref:ABC transporter permease subunit n=1 Tax=unclassified Herbaspirillum TaxID=2624150 RepID=UPI000E2E9EE4|nr:MULTISPECIES: ABC transporter permease subunit [unclassified Herbaspirillum]RFB67922.1 ABC transporter permease subunit [Herbaspirillum sp. 3R-3a1]TFI06358.1 ABC transporter permease subunit [Herbaspirillum sp. 3R11]TFI14030.1 ABC transporter permease subunit [Herbaspirillum sp. 3R-11]TFI25199.1 ABC transporter permease subunit [Herbaspirillum sp. 3C11]
MSSSFLPSAAKKSLRAWLPALPCFVFLICFFCVPVVEILQTGIVNADGHATLDQFRRMTNDLVFAKVLGNTFLISGLTALLSVALGFPVAYFLSQLSDRFRERWMIWIMVPFWTSYLVKTFAWILMLSKTGILLTLAASLGLVDDPHALAPSMMGVMIGMVHAMLPLAVINMLPIMRGVNAQLLQAAETLGANRSIAFFSVFLPMAGPGIAAAGLLVFITSLGFFILPALLGTPKETMVAQLVISAINDLFNLPYAAALSTILLIFAVAVFILYDKLVGLSSLSGDARAAPKKNSSAATTALLIGIGRLCGNGYGATGPVLQKVKGLKLYSVLAVALLSLPIVVVFPIAFTNSPFLSFPPQGFSLRWFEAFIFSPVWQASFLRSFGVAIVTALASTALGIGAALALTRLPPRWTKPVFAFLLAPLIVPRIVVAVGLFYLFSRMGLVGTDLGLTIGHTVLAIPYVVVTMAAALKRFDWRLDDAARILGASAFARLRTIQLPMMIGSVAAALQMAFIISFDELTIAIFVSGGMKNTLPKQMWDDMILQVNPTLAAVSLVMVIVIALLVLLPAFYKMARRRTHAVH